MPASIVRENAQSHGRSSNHRRGPIGHECTLLTRGSNHLYPFGEHRFYPRDIVNCDDFTECG